MKCILKTFLAWFLALTSVSSLYASNNMTFEQVRSQIGNVQAADSQFERGYFWNIIANIFQPSWRIKTIFLSPFQLSENPSFHNTLPRWTKLNSATEGRFEAGTITDNGSWIWVWIAPHNTAILRVNWISLFDGVINANNWVGATNLNLLGSNSILFATNSNPRMTILSNGSVGIWNLTPTERLHVSWKILAQSPASTDWPNIVATKGYVDSVFLGGSGISQSQADSRYVNVSGDTMTGDLNIQDNRLVLASGWMWEGGWSNMRIETTPGLDSQWNPRTIRLIAPGWVLIWEAGTNITSLRVGTNNIVSRVNIDMSWNEIQDIGRLEMNWNIVTNGNNINMGNGQIFNVPNPTQNNHVANKAYVDSVAGSSGWATYTWGNGVNINSSNNISLDTSFTDNIYLNKSGDRMNWSLNMANNTIINLPAPTWNNQPATKAYVDSVAGGWSCATRTTTWRGSATRSCSSWEEFIRAWCTPTNYQPAFIANWATCRHSSSSSNVTVNIRCCS